MKLPLHTYGSVVFASWRQCAPHVTHASFGPLESTTQCDRQTDK